MEILLIDNNRITPRQYQLFSDNSAPPDLFEFGNLVLLTRQHLILSSSTRSIFIDVLGKFWEDNPQARLSCEKKPTDKEFLDYLEKKFPNVVLVHWNSAPRGAREKKGQIVILGPLALSLDSTTTRPYKLSYQLRSFITVLIIFNELLHDATNTFFGPSPPAMGGGTGDQGSGEREWELEKGLFGGFDILGEQNGDYYVVLIEIERIVAVSDDDAGGEAFYLTSDFAQSFLDSLKTPILARLKTSNSSHCTPAPSSGGVTGTRTKVAQALKAKECRPFVPTSGDFFRSGCCGDREIVGDVIR